MGRGQWRKFRIVAIAPVSAEAHGTSVGGWRYLAKPRLEPPPPPVAVDLEGPRTTGRGPLRPNAVCLRWP